MRNLIDDWKKLKEMLVGKHLALFLDYDGTLTPISSTPQKAVMSQETRSLLEAIVGLPQCSLAIISGRASVDVKRLVDVENIIYIGNHGLEIEGPGIKFENLSSPQLKNILKFFKDKLTKKLVDFPGVFIEDKGLTLSVHYRRIAKEKELFLQKAINKITNPYVDKKKIRLGLGKMVVEIKPPVEWDKGKAVLWLLTRQEFAYAGNVFPVCIGDDVTDEDAFGAVKGIGWGVHVGDSKVSHAEYCLKDSVEVVNFLKRIYRLKKDEKIVEP